MESGHIRVKQTPKQTAQADRHTSLRLRTGVRAGDNDDDCLACANCMYKCVASGRGNCNRECAQQCGPLT
jgi:hypothetical protein